MWSGDQGLNQPGDYEDPEQVISILKGEEDEQQQEV